MPALDPSANPTVLVTGANGYISLWVLLKLLEAGFTVRGTVRSSAKASALLANPKFAAYAGQGRLETAIVEDITKEGAFDDAVKGVEGVLHMASPVDTVGVEDPQQLIKPALDGTLTILQSALVHGKMIKRITITSSVAAILDFKAFPSLSEKNWNEGAIKSVEKKGKDAPLFTQYMASKTLAEKAAWKFVEDHKQEIGWDLTVLLPPYVYGPLLDPAESPKAFSASMKQFYHFLFPSPSTLNPDVDQSLTSPAWWADVRDVATAHVLSLVKEEAGGERIIISAGGAVPQEWVTIANTLPSTLTSFKPSSGIPELTKGLPDTKIKYPLALDTTKEKTILGITFKTKEETVRDVLEQFVEAGW